MHRVDICNCDQEPGQRRKIVKDEKIQKPKLHKHEDLFIYYVPVKGMYMYNDEYCPGLSTLIKHIITKND